ncbi:hypothetical protein D9615_009005 [Tricholomella constricta]|uniref:Uncharacterized protein n=1 Tax=Tricholomella constricta TaxID=117010 RepID=A0A8H5H0U9_9AGAR|nr:hypothetical protein D9615_009005 [Tricholomella constricta]
MPPSMEPGLLVRRSDEGPNSVLIIAAVVGGLLLIAIAVVIAVYLARRNRNGSQASQRSNRLRHKHTASDVSAASLLYPRPYWRTPTDGYAPHGYSRPSFERLHDRNCSTDSVATVKPMHDEKFSVPPANTVPFLAETSRPPQGSHSPLFIHPPALHVSANSVIPDSPYALAPPIARSDSSESLYSQASAPSRKSSFFFPPFTPRYTHPPEEEEAAEPDTQTIGKLLKERAKRNPNKISRSVSRIERAGSIKAAEDDDDDDNVVDGNEGTTQPLRPLRSRRSKSKRKAATPLVTVVEGSDPGASPPSSSRGGLTLAVNRQWDVEVPAPPPATHLATTCVHNELSPPRPQSLFIPRTSSGPQNPMHTSSRSLDGPAEIQGAGWNGRPSQPINAGSAPPRAHVRRESAERTLDVMHPMGRAMSTHGSIRGFFEH